MSPPNTPKHRRELRNAFDTWMDDLAFPLFLTLNINAPASFKSARRLLKNFAAKLDRRLLGPRYHKRTDTRTLFIAVPENEHSNFHYHVLMEVNATHAPSMLELETLITAAWEGVILSGSVWLRGIHDDGAARYTAKDLMKYEHFNEFIISTEFQPQ
jgi:uncharacterized protein (DUF1810 family)